MSSTKNRSESKTLKELEAKIEEEAQKHNSEILLHGMDCMKGFCARKNISVEALAKALLNDRDMLLKEVKTNIINEIVKQAKEAR